MLITKEDVNKAYITKKFIQIFLLKHLLSSLVNEAKDIVLKDIS